MKKIIVPLIFSICFMYWGYLFFSTQMDISMDAIGFENTAKVLHEKGWIELFKTGPNKEPLYFFIISISMDIGQYFLIPYTQVQKVFQICFLFLTQVLTLKILNGLKVKDSLIYSTILYVGFSPALVNATFSLFSEIVSFPFILATVILNTAIYKELQNGIFRQIIRIGLMSAIFYILAVSAKGIFVVIMNVFLLTYFVTALLGKRQQKSRLFVNTLTYIIMVLVIFQSFYIAYKSLNKKYNGNFVYTSRFERLFYANAAKRARPLTMSVFLSHLAFIPGEGICRIFFTEKECEYCGLRTQDHLGGMELPQLLRETPPEQREAKSMALAFAKIKENPSNYILFMLIESTKMFFWESTQIGFVKYPAPLSKLYASKPFKNVLRLGVSLLTVYAFFYLLCFVSLNRQKIFAVRNDGQKDITVLTFFILLLLVTFIGGYSVMTTLTRYALPLAPIYLILIAFSLDRHNKRMS